MPTNAIARLVDAVPPPVGARPSFNWADVESRVGRALPDDYKAIAEVYGSGQFDRFIMVHVPDPDRSYVDLLTAVRRGREQLEAFAAHGEAMPYPPEDLMLVASTENGDSIYWAAPQGRQANEWTVVVTGARDFDEFPEYDLGLADFLAEVLSGRLRVDAFAPDFPDERPVFVPEDDE